MRIKMTNNLYWIYTFSRFDNGDNESNKEYWRERTLLKSWNQVKYKHEMCLHEQKHEQEQRRESEKDEPWNKCDISFIHSSRSTMYYRLFYLIRWLCLDIHIILPFIICFLQRPMIRTGCTIVHVLSIVFMHAIFVIRHVNWLTS